MLEVIGVKFKNGGRIYYYLKPDFKIKKGENVIAQLNKADEYGTVEIEKKLINENDLSYTLTNITRVATKDDNEKYANIKEREKQALEIFKEKIKEYKLVMKAINVELSFELNKILFYFIAETRVDFREIVKDLASIFKMRIELRQIGVRDQAKILNGVGVCGRTLCCSTFLKEFQPVSIKMAKDQNLSLNPTKISGACGRLMCCLKYEQDTYEELNQNSPKEGDIIKVASGEGEVLSVDILRQIVKAAIRKNPQDTPNVSYFKVDEVEIIKKKSVKKESIDKEEIS